MAAIQLRSEVLATESDGSLTPSQNPDTDPQRHPAERCVPS